jgi:hypothetical protein
VFFAAGCGTGEFGCTTLEADAVFNAGSIALSAALLGGTYALYRWRKRKAVNEFNI